MDSCDSNNTMTPPQNGTAQDSKACISPKVQSGVKKDSPVNGQSPASGRLVYVRRKVEVDTWKVSPAAAKEPTTTTLALVSSSPQGPTSHKFGWEERYHHLQMLLNKLNESDQTDHIKMLWSLPSAELSKHAVELEKRSIQLSLEEAREMQRVAALNVLGRSVNSTSNEGEEE